MTDIEIVEPEEPAPVDGVHESDRDQDKSSPPSGEDTPRPTGARIDWVEVVSAVILALATVASAWSAYQATRWSGVMAIEFSQATATRALANQAHAQAGQLIQIDVTTFLAWAEAVSTGDEQLEDFLYERLRPEFQVAVDAWLATGPLTDPDAPPTPFDMDAYRIAEAERGDALLADADEMASDARAANQTGDNYVMTTVLFASVLFFAGIATKFSKPAVKRGLIALALLSFLAGSVIIATFPVH